MKNVSDQKVADPLKRLNPWWASSAMDQGLTGPMKFVRNNRLALALASTRSQFGKDFIEGAEIRQWPSGRLRCPDERFFRL